MMPGAQYAQAFAQTEAEFFRLPDVQKKLRDIARAIVQLQPQLELDCVMRMLPGLMRDAADLISGGLNAGDIGPVVNLIVKHLGDLVKCQFGTSPQFAAYAASPEALNEKLLSCAIRSGWAFFQDPTRDLNKALSGFLACVLGGVVGGGGGGTGGGNGGGGTGSGGAVFAETPRCPGGGGINDGVVNQASDNTAQPEGLR
jgi:hypothetical protein